MIKKLKKTINIWRDNLYLQRIVWNNGLELEVFRGTIKDTPDKDDAWYYELAKNYGSIYDVGANIGFTALLALLADKDKKVVLVEANKKALAMAAYNLLNNGYSANCTFINGFVADKEAEEVKFYTVGAGAAGSMYSEHAKTASAMNQYMMVRTLTLDNVYDKTRVLPDLIKIDVEGAENKVLRGISEIMRHTSPDIFLEIHSNRDLPMVDNANDVLEWCEVNKYKAWYLKEKKLLVSAEMIAHRGRCHLLLLPAGKSFPENLLAINQNDPIK